MESYPSPAARSAPPAVERQPSQFYRASLWRVGLLMARALPLSLARGVGRLMGHAYWMTQPRRRAVVTRNLLPILGGDERAARRAAQRLFVEFALKLTDLWRWEAGISVTHRFDVVEGWDHFGPVHARGQGVLLVTPHLGNWELGAPLLVEQGVQLLVITQPEPGRQFTELRRVSRARWGVETLVVGQDAFAFVGLIQRLQAGATVAILIDRPLPSSAVEIEFFGRPFLGSLAPAELARASGCALLGAYLVRQGRGYAAYLLPEFTYDRRALGNREARRQFTQRLFRAFEPVIRQYADQWFHFVPVWPTKG